MQSCTAFLVGLNALQNMYALYGYGDRDESRPYVQLISVRLIISRLVG